MKKIICLALISIAEPCFADNPRAQLESAAGLSMDAVKPNIPTAQLGVAATKVLWESNPFLYAPLEDFHQMTFTYLGYFNNVEDARADLAIVLRIMKTVSIAVLQSGVAVKAAGIDYSIAFLSGVSVNNFTYNGWIKDRNTAQLKLDRASGSLAKAGIPVLQATVRETSQGIDYYLAFLARSAYRSYEYSGYLPTESEADKAMAECMENLEAAGFPVIQADVRTSAQGIDFVVRYLTPQSYIPTPAATAAVSAILANSRSVK